MKPWDTTGGEEWRAQWRRRIRTVSGLHRLLRARGISAPDPAERAIPFPFRVTPYYAGLIRRADTADPIYRQCVPGPEETPGPNVCVRRRARSAKNGALPEEESIGFAADPFQEMTAHRPVPGVIRRYRDRAVWVAATACAVHCRHCTRRHELGARGLSRVRLDHARAWLAGEPDVREIILSGGDPLSLSDTALERLLRTAQSVPHVERVRIGTRMPVVLPQRITPALVAMLRRYAPVWVATHFNHPVELTKASARACARLVGAGIPVLNQTVLLRGVNDTPEALGALFQGLANMRVKPYYLLHCDPVRGLGHFRVPVEQGLALMDRLRAEISGLAVPVYAADVPGAAGKVPLSRSTLLGHDGQTRRNLG